jgi:hypothetical protein
MPMKVTSTPYFLNPQLQPLQNGARLDFWDGCKTFTNELRTIKFLILIDLETMNNS